MFLIFLLVRSCSTLVHYIAMKIRHSLMRWLNAIPNSMDMSFSELQEFVMSQGSQVCCNPWGCKESDTTNRLK